MRASVRDRGAGRRYNTSDPTLRVLQQPSLAAPWGSCQPVHFYRDNLPASLLTSNPALTSNSKSGNFKHKQTSLPQTTSEDVPKEGQR